MSNGLTTENTESTEGAGLECKPWRVNDWHGPRAVLHMIYVFVLFVFFVFFVVNP